VNTGAPWPGLVEAERRVRKMQAKLHQWATADPDRRFDDLHNLVYDPAFLVVAWSRVRTNKGARTAGVDGVAPRAVGSGAGRLLGQLRDDLKAGRLVPQRVREKAIPKASGKLRRLGIATTADRVVQASLKLVLEPIFEADFHPCSYGFRPKRRAQDAIAEIHHLASPNRNYEWVLEADITACFDEIDHTALMGRVRRRIGDKRVLGLVTAFLRAGSSATRAATASRSPAHPRAASSRRCWPTSPCPSWTSTSPPGGRRSARNGSASSTGVPAARS
jgi:RNA-directed DNA polymerase